MRQADAQFIMVSYADEGGADQAVDRVFVSLRSYGLSFAGALEGYEFEASPASEARYERGDMREAIVERLPVTPPPHHWYWRRVER